MLRFFRRRRKHVDTCPDVIYWKNQQKRNARFAIGVLTALVVGGYAYGVYLDKKDRREIEASRT